MGFIIGIFIGSIIGWGACALFTVGKRGDV